MTNSFRHRIRELIPKPLHRPIRYAETYAKRIIIWFSVIRYAKGVSAKDSLNLWISFLASPVTCARSLGQWCDPLLLADTMVHISDVGDFTVRSHSDDLWHVLPSREQAITDTINTLLEPGDCFIDAGANIGFYSVLAARRVGLSGRVVAIEMMPDTANILRKHCSLNDLEKIRVVENALSDKDGDTVTACVAKGKFGQASIAGTLDTAGTYSIQVESATLDSVLAGIGEVKLMKLDLEGVEAIALSGAEHCLSRTQSVIFEYWNEDDDVSDFLIARGFSVRDLDGRNAIASR